MKEQRNPVKARDQITGTVGEIIEKLFNARETITSGQVASAAGITRQAAYYRLNLLVAEGLLIHEGGGRGGHYRQLAQQSSEYKIHGLKEDLVWTEEKHRLKLLGSNALEKPNVVKILNFVFTEMLNNAIDHSGGTEVKVRWYESKDRISFEIEDNGIGVFRRIRESRHLADDFEAVGEISKGKQTTSPKQHSGLGIFFSSRMVSRFIIAGGQITWKVDNEHDDVAMGWLDRERVGTLVRCEIDLSTTTTPQQVFNALSNPETDRFDTTRIRVDLFRTGDFVSRTEAKRIGASLEDFDVVELDFDGLSEIGQGFADELFRVWTTDNPQTKLTTVNTNPAIDSMIAAVRAR